MADKRGTGAEYGQDLLRERSAEADAPDPTKKVAKKKLLSVIVAAIIAGGAMGAVILTTDKTPAEKVEALSVEISNDGVPLTAKVKSDIEKSGSQSTEEPAPDAIAVTKTGEDSAHTPTLEIAERNKTDIPASDSLTPDDAVDVTVPAPTIDVKPAEEVVKAAQSTVEPTEEPRGYDPAKFGITADDAPVITEPKPAETTPSQNTSIVAAPVAPVPTPAPGPVPGPEPEPVRMERVELPADNQYAQQNVMMTGADLNYTGSALNVEYKTQQQDTLYLYSSFAAKIFLLPTDRGENISAYLSDEKGWKLTLLPGGILRVQRSENKSSWSQATDLFIVAGKRTYSLILQGVGDPSKRTDSLRYTSSEPEKKAKLKSKK